MKFRYQNVSNGNYSHNFGGITLQLRHAYCSNRWILWGYEGLTEALAINILNKNMDNSFVIALVIRTINGDLLVK